MALGRFDKQPREIKDYPIDYTDWLAEIEPADFIVGFEVISIIAARDPTDTSLSIFRTELSPSGVSVWLSGGTVGLTYKVQVLTTTQAGRKDEQEFFVTLKDT